MSQHRMLRADTVARTFEEAVDGVLTDLLRFATYRSIGFEVDQVAEVMHITLGLADHYEAEVARLMKGVDDRTAPDAPEAVPDPPKEIHS